MEEIAIGIDLGTTNSCAAYYVNGRTKILENSEGGRITPSVLFFMERDGAIIVGKFAKHMAISKPEYAVYEIKRLVGRKIDDPYVQNNLRYFPFKLDEESSEPQVIIEQPSRTLKICPVDICAAILKKIKSDVEAKLGHPVSKAVITVPAYFNVNQREVTLAAAAKAGFTVLKLLNEPTAAALSYYLENNCPAENHSLVFDLGGGTFDVAILKRSSDKIDIIAVDGDSHLGGQDLDNLIIDYVCDELNKRYKFNPRPNRRTMRRLHNHCEEAKKTLSVAEETTIILDGFITGHNTVEIVLTRQQFETMADHLFQKTIQIMDNCLNSSNVSKTAIKEVILSGGSTRIPKLQKLISEYFNNKALNKFVNPDECVAEGAAIQAAMLSQEPCQKVNSIRITDVIPLSLGVPNFVDLMTFLIKRNTPIPTSASCSRVTLKDKQINMLFEVYEGERPYSKKNRFLGEMTIGNITLAPPGKCEVTITMSIDHNGILTVSAKEKYKDNVKDLKVTYTRGCRSEGEVKNALKDAEDHKDEDSKFIAFAKRKQYLIKYCIAAVYNFESKNLVNSFKEHYNLCKKIQGEADSMTLEDESKILNMIKEVEKKCEAVVRDHKFETMPVYNE